MDNVIILVIIDYTTLLLFTNHCYHISGLRYEMMKPFNWKLRVPHLQLTPLSKSTSRPENDVAQPDYW